MVDGSTGNGRPSGHDAVSRSVSNSIIDSYARRRRPWNGGVSSLRCCRWASPVIANNDPGPSTEPRLASGVSASSGLVWNSCLTSAGSASITIRPRLSDWTVNAEPYRARRRCMVRLRPSAKDSACTSRGLVGPSGRTASGSVSVVIAHLPWYAPVPGPRYDCVPRPHKGY